MVGIVCLALATTFVALDIWIWRIRKREDRERRAYWKTRDDEAQRQHEEFMRAMSCKSCWSRYQTRHRPKRLSKPPLKVVP